MRKSILLLYLLSLFVFSTGTVYGQVATATPTQAAVISLTSTPTPTTGGGTATPTGITKLPETGFSQYTGLFAAASLGIIIFALLF